MPKADPISWSDSSTLSGGAELDVAACAIDGEQLDASVKSDSTMIVAGKTAKLNLNVSVAASFNGGFHVKDLEAANAIVKVSGKAEVGLCAVRSIEGKASTGAEIFTAEQADLKIELGTGGKVSHVGC